MAWIDHKFPHIDTDAQGWVRVSLSIILLIFFVHDADGIIDYHHIFCCPNIFIFNFRFRGN